ncbi:hypothetical protein TSAR_013770 [Trichomalopsis sarcophagae]|uniref:Uncharacterized protein n=1 Tax=Trichomalopsis sarcophagae TaxID=543379 RepID=A0A232FMU9_9HYME|nr:hypothetical protein TSAR_013770 [Trichomalopsis sarcophagae]
MQSLGNVPKILGPAWKKINLAMKKRTFRCVATLPPGCSNVVLGRGNIAESSESCNAMLRQGCQNIKCYMGRYSCFNLGIELIMTTKLSDF